MGKPNLFLIGAMKSGSTTLHELLAEHPGICMSEPKEPCYFVEPELLKELWPEMWRMNIWKSEENYLALFRHKPDATWFGESSTDYSKLPGIPGVVEKIAAYNPDARFIYIMRDPVRRTISHYWHMVEHRGEKRPPMAAVKENPLYMDCSHYAKQLRPYLETFGADQVSVLTFEELLADPEATVQGVFRWLGVDGQFVPDDLHGARNATSQTVAQERTGTGMLKRLRHSQAWGRIGGFVPPAIRRLGVAMLQKDVQRKGVDMKAVEDYLRPIQREQTKELEELTGRSFPQWSCVNHD